MVHIKHPLWTHPSPTNYNYPCSGEPTLTLPCNRDYLQTTLLPSTIEKLVKLIAYSCNSRARYCRLTEGQSSHIS